MTTTTAGLIDTTTAGLIDTTTAGFTDLALDLMNSGAKLLETAKTAVPRILALQCPEEGMEKIFAACRGAADGVAWNAAKAALRYQFKKAGFNPAWPNYRSGKGTCTLSRIEKAPEKGSEEAPKNLNAEGAEILRRLGPADLAGQIIHLITVWGGDPQTVIALVTKAFAPPDT